ncbi:CpsB/CapC family capsule biosynthesis tyrosine phosphatase [Lachnobacterium bovis]|uniref:protein-tyrosine-phosphatase n=1 Tax=Lachnobacterium bovis TaxID=140626 RepID=A0A1H9PG58_9FIRM|nr:CpsB/CapC family capsule biosynthesis tyrosine phosphatase [Lachnobacterium bovis]SER47137.1 protein-tyrosine phosphatase [Lachnobacterium bovis]
MLEGFIDIHSHILPGVDDGARNLEMAEKMIEMALEDGIIGLVLTPHIKAPRYLLPEEEIVSKFEELKEIVRSKYPQMHLYLGGEFYFYSSILEESPHIIRTINKTDYVLVEFSPMISYDEMLRAFQKLKACGYDVILAHVERYEVLRKDLEKVEHVKGMGVLIQMNANTIYKPNDREHKKFMKKVLKEELIDLVATDAHDLNDRKPNLSKAANYVVKKIGMDYAQDIFMENQLRILQGKRIN